MDTKLEERVSCSSLGYQSEKIKAGTYRSDFIPANPTDRQKSNAIQSLFKKMGWTTNLCTGNCPNDKTHECVCTGLMSITTDDCELTYEKEMDGTRYYKAVVKAPGKVEFKCPGLAGDVNNMCKCLPKVL